MRRAPTMGLSLHVWSSPTQDSALTLNSLLRLADILLSVATVKALASTRASHSQGWRLRSSLRPRDIGADTRSGQYISSRAHRRVVHIIRPTSYAMRRTKSMHKTGNPMISLLRTLMSSHSRRYIVGFHPSADGQDGGVQLSHSMTIDSA